MHYSGKYGKVRPPVLFFHPDKTMWPRTDRHQVVGPTPRSERIGKQGTTGKVCLWCRGGVLSQPGSVGEVSAGMGTTRDRAGRQKLTLRFPHYTPLQVDVTRREFSTTRLLSDRKEPPPL